MGDVLTLIEKVQADFDEEKAKEMERKLKKSEFDFNDYLESFKQVKKLGGIGKMLNMMPGMNSQMKNAADNVDEKQIARVEAIIYSMTPAERANPKLLNPSRKNRIARGAGVDIAEVNRLVKQQEQMKKMMKQLPGMMGGIIIGMPSFLMPIMLAPYFVLKFTSLIVFPIHSSNGVIS